jgi:hypothetical protein
MLKLTKANIAKETAKNTTEKRKEKKVFVGLDVHKNQWNATLLTEEGEIFLRQ